MKKLISLILTMAIVLVALAGCSGAASSSTSLKASSSSAPASSQAKVYNIGIAQIVEHPSLNQIRESIIAELSTLGFKEGANVKYDYQNAQGDMANLKSICQKFSGAKYDLIVAIATPTAQAAAGETSTIPVIFSACTDPITSGLVSSLENPGKNVTGTSDAVSAEEIMKLALQLTPNIKTIGALYNASETNSVSVINDLKAFAAKKGLTVIEATATSTADVQQAVTSLVGKVDAIFTPIDNTVAAAMPIVAEVTTKNKIPYYVGADTMVTDGGFATYGINYDILGRETASMVAKVLKGAKPGDIPVKLMTDMNIYINVATAKAIGIEIPAEIKAKATLLGK